MKTLSSIIIIIITTLMQKSCYLDDPATPADRSLPRS